MYTIKIKTFSEDHYVTSSDYIGVGNLFLSYLGSNNQRVEIYEKIDIGERLIVTAWRNAPLDRWLLNRILNVF